MRLPAAVVAGAAIGASAYLGVDTLDWHMRGGTEVARVENCAYQLDHGSIGDILKICKEYITDMPMTITNNNGLADSTPRNLVFIGNFMTGPDFLNMMMPQARGDDAQTEQRIKADAITSAILGDLATMATVWLGLSSEGRKRFTRLTSPQGQPSWEDLS
ncbi:MAG TPA: hypothetical protein VHD60_00830 [Candidatus Saccharimonadales bacterium]|nr:hypothetical protein [Candidatus Saccharimonadales bacterium]